MSYVADVILLTFLDERGIVEVQKWLRNNEWPELVKISDNAGGNKAMQCEIWAAAINYFDVDGFALALTNILWESPKSVQLLIKNENDDEFELLYSSNTINKEV